MSKSDKNKFPQNAGLAPNSAPTEETYDQQETVITEASVIEQRVGRIGAPSIKSAIRLAGFGETSGEPARSEREPLTEAERGQMLAEFGHKTADGSVLFNPEAGTQVVRDASRDKAIDRTLDEAFEQLGISEDGEEV